MRQLTSISIILLALALSGCAADSVSDGAPEEPLFKITSSDITLAPGAESTKCFYFRTPNTDYAHVHKWVSDMSPGSHHMIYFSNLGGSQPPDGTVDDCEGAGNTPLPVYGSQTAHQEADFPKDDTGVQLAQSIVPNSAGYFQMHYVNATDAPLTAHVELSAYALATTAEYTRTDLFGTYNADISIPPHATNYKVTATCDVVRGKFWSMSTHSHKQTVATSVRDGGTPIFSSADWEHPGATVWSAPEFHTFSGKMTWECTYDNLGDNANLTIRDGQSARTNEMCMATGYYFPASGPRGCVMSGGQCQCLLD